MMRCLVLIIGPLVLLSTPVMADLVVNEVLSDEPGSSVSLEWCELYNDSDDSTNLGTYELKVFSPTGSESFLLQGWGWLHADKYLVVCRDSIRFEEHFGDSSGAWGDSEIENFTIRQQSLQLTNTSGSVVLYRLNTPPSELAWTESGIDGVSWERVEPDSDSTAQSQDLSGSTPGRINSHTRLPLDLVLQSVRDTLIDGFTRMEFEIVNRGRTPVDNALLNLHYFDAGAPDSLGAQIASEPVGVIDTGFTIILIGQYSLAGIYQSLSAVVSVAGDNRPDNNRINFVAPGQDFPPVALSEVLANPSGELNSEWVELKNISSEVIDLVGWQLGDSTSLVSISILPLEIEPGGRIVLVEDASDFLSFYSGFVGLIHEPSQWPVLNNSSDVVRLVDRYDISVDLFEYETTFEDNHTWARGESLEYENVWGRSEDTGGTPGEVNVVRFTSEPGSSVEISIEPQIFSPDGNGHEDSTVIKVNSPGGSSTLKMYDSQGRLVKTFEEDAPDLSEQYVWKGESDTGGRLPIGIYILYFEISGVESFKRTVVIAR